MHRFVCRTGIFRILLPRAWRQRVITISIENEPTYRLMLGKREVGQYDTAARQWRIPVQWRIFVDESKLPTVTSSNNKG